jgi:hypothetical protein
MTPRFKKVQSIDLKPVGFETEKFNLTRSLTLTLSRLHFDLVSVGDKRKHELLTNQDPLKKLS